MARVHGIHEPGRRFRLDVDLAESLIVTGRRDDATKLADELDQIGRRLDRPSLRGNAARIRGLVSASRRSLREADRLLARAVDEHERSPLPADLARSLLARAEIQQRRRDAAAAAASLGRCAEILAGLDDPDLSDRLTRLRLAATPRVVVDTLSPVQRRVAELAAAGATSRQIATTLRVSPRTVDSHLASVYRALGIRRRAQLRATLPPGRSDS